MRPWRQRGPGSAQVVPRGPGPCTAPLIPAQRPAGQEAQRTTQLRATPSPALLGGINSPPGINPSRSMVHRAGQPSICGQLALSPNLAQRRLPFEDMCNGPGGTMGAQTKDDNRGQWEGTNQWPGRARSRGSCGQERGQMPTAARERDGRPRPPRRGDGRLQPPNCGCPTASPEASMSQHFLTQLRQDPQAAPAPSPTQQALLRPGLPLQPCGPIGPPRPRHGGLRLCWT